MTGKRNIIPTSADSGPEAKRSRREPGFYIALNDGFEHSEPGEDSEDSVDDPEVVVILDDDCDSINGFSQSKKNTHATELEPLCLSLKHTVWSTHCNIQHLLDKDPVMHNKKSVYDVKLSCRYCAEQSYTLSSCGLKTSNFYKHLKRKHRREYEKMNTPKEANDIAKLVHAKSKLDKSIQFKDDLINFFIENYISFRSVDSKSFKSLFRNIDVENKIGSSKTLRKMVYEKFQKQYKILLDNVEKSVSCSLQLDVWRSPLDNRSYLGIIIVFIDPITYLKQTNCLALKEVTDAHTGDKLAQIVYEIMSDSPCLEKLNHITCDSASNNATLCSSLADKLKQNSINGISFNPECRINCLAHVVNRIIQCLFSNLNNSFLSDAMSKITEFFKSVHNKTAYNNIWYDKKGKNGGLPPLPIEIRWNSIFTTINYFFKYIELILSVDITTISDFFSHINSDTNYVSHG